MKTSISGKLLAITLGVVLLAVGLAGGGLLRQHNRELRRGFEESTVVLARAIAEHCVGPVVFEDRRGADEILAKLARSNVVERARLYGSQGNLLAAYDRLAGAAPVLSLQTTAAVEHSPGYLHVFEPVTHQDGRAGTLYLTASSAGLDARVWTGRMTILVVGLAAILLAGVLAWVLQRNITRPILRLAETMHGITDQTMLSTRVQYDSRDEIGTLYAGFNRMVGQLAARQRERDRSDARLRALIAALPDPVFVLDQEGRIVEVLAGRSGPSAEVSGQLRGKRLSEVTGAEQSRPFAEALAKVLTTGEPQRLAYELETETGKRWFDAVAVPIAGDPGA
ncbi:MAG TPA: CHASE sensor domain-containing protein, partial [Polyangia bacterium]